MNAHPSWPFVLLRWSVVAIFVRCLIGILLEYRWYFPLDFAQSSFFLGRQAIFSGWYPVAFYVHIIASPIALLLTTWLIFSGQRSGNMRWHRYAGRTLGVLVLLGVLPSGMVMATKAIGGPVSAWGLFALATATGLTVVMAAVRARQHSYVPHRRWATRCFLLLLSPLLLRMVIGLNTVVGFDYLTVYQWSAWLSWLVPLLVYEIRFSTQSAHAPTPVNLSV